MIETATELQELPPLPPPRARRRATKAEPPEEPAATPPLLADAVEVSRLLGISRTAWYALISSARAPAGLKLGRCRRWSVRELCAWTAAGAPPLSRWDYSTRGGRR
jgi:predicted DNA-binding transcriptional regulator AlpA